MVVVVRHYASVPGGLSRVRLELHTQHLTQSTVGDRTAMMTACLVPGALQGCEHQTDRRAFQPQLRAIAQHIGRRQLRLRLHSFTRQFLVRVILSHGWARKTATRGILAEWPTAERNPNIVRAI
jgi:hypothetical protein